MISFTQIDREADIRISETTDGSLMLIATPVTKAGKDALGDMVASITIRRSGLQDFANRMADKGVVVR